MIVYIFIDSRTNERVHKIETTGQIHVRKTMYMFVEKKLYLVQDEPQLHVFKEHNLNVYTVKLNDVNSNLDDEAYKTEVLNNIQDIIRDAKINKIVD
jgi:hypothetical protein